MARFLSLRQNPQMRSKLALNKFKILFFNYDSSSSRPRRIVFIYSPVIFEMSWMPIFCTSYNLYPNTDIRQVSYLFSELSLAFFHTSIVYRCCFVSRL